MIDSVVFNLSDLTCKRQLQSAIGRLDGNWRVTVKPARPRTTDPQRGYYFGVIVKFFADFIREHDPTLTVTEASETAHYQIKLHNLPEPIVDNDGRIIATKVGSVAKIDVKTMSKLIDDSIEWLGAEWQISVPPPTHEEHFGRATASAG